MDGTIAFATAGGATFRSAVTGNAKCLRRDGRASRSWSRRRQSTQMVQSEVRPDKVSLDWENLGFEYVQTRCHARMTYEDGAWSSIEFVNEPYLKLHIGATALHYGQSCFEGLKAFRCRDGVVRIFRPDMNAQRMARSAHRLMIPEISESLFLEAVHGVVVKNEDYIPPYGTGGSLYIRPLLFGSGAKIGLGSSHEFTFIVMVVPVGDYYKGGLAPVTALIEDKYDRAAPRGIGNVKLAGNYAADLLPSTEAKRAGYPINLYLDARNRRTIEEFGTSNFIALKGNSYITPNSPSVLRSVTNNTLMQLARDIGMKVEEREIDVDELYEFDEVGACGTAVIITAVSRLVFGSKVIEIGSNPEAVGKGLQRFYSMVRAIQCGEAEDRHQWCHALRKN